LIISANIIFILPHITILPSYKSQDVFSLKDSLTNSIQLSVTITERYN